MSHENNQINVNKEMIDICSLGGAGQKNAEGT